MLDTIKNILGIKPNTNYKDLISKGAVILDVRSIAEYQSGHIKGSINIPVDNLLMNLKKISKKKTIITCCASGMRSERAKTLLKQNGYINVYNAGAWSNLKNL